MRRLTRGRGRPRRSGRRRDGRPGLGGGEEGGRARQRALQENKTEGRLMGHARDDERTSVCKTGRGPSMQRKVKVGQVRTVGRSGGAKWGCVRVAGRGADRKGSRRESKEGGLLCPCLSSLLLLLPSLRQPAPPLPDTTTNNTPTTNPDINHRDPYARTLSLAAAGTHIAWRGRERNELSTAIFFGLALGARAPLQRPKNQAIDPHNHITTTSTTTMSCFRACFGRGDAAGADADVPNGGNRRSTAATTATTIASPLTMHRNPRVSESMMHGGGGSAAQGEIEAAFYHEQQQQRQQQQHGAPASAAAATTKAPRSSRAHSPELIDLDMAPLPYALPTPPASVAGRRNSAASASAVVTVASGAAAAKTTTTTTTKKGGAGNATNATTAAPPPHPPAGKSARRRANRKKAAAAAAAKGETTTTAAATSPSYARPTAAAMAAANATAAQTQARARRVAAGASEASWRK